MSYHGMPNASKITKIRLSKELSKQIANVIKAYKRTGYLEPSLDYIPKDEEILIAYTDCTDTDLADGFDGQFDHELNLITIDEESDDCLRTLAHEIIHYFQHKFFFNNDFDYDTCYEDRWHEVQASILSDKVKEIIEDKYEEDIICANPSDADKYYFDLVMKYNEQHPSDDLDFGDDI